MEPWDSMVEGVKNWAEKNDHLAPQAWNTPCSDERRGPNGGVYRVFTLTGPQVKVRAFVEGGKVKVEKV